MCCACHWLREPDGSQTRFAPLYRKQLAVTPIGLMGTSSSKGMYAMQSGALVLAARHRDEYPRLLARVRSVGKFNVAKEELALSFAATIRTPQGPGKTAIGGLHARVAVREDGACVGECRREFLPLTRRRIAFYQLFGRPVAIARVR